MDPKRPSAVDKLDRLTLVFHAASQLLIQVVACVRQVVSIAGWLVLLVSTVSLLIDSHISLAHLVTPGAGALAVLQGMIKARAQPPPDSSDEGSDDLPDGLPKVVDDALENIIPSAREDVELYRPEP